MRNLSSYRLVAIIILKVLNYKEMIIGPKNAAGYERKIEMRWLGWHTDRKLLSPEIKPAPSSTAWSRGNLLKKIL